MKTKRAIPPVTKSNWEGTGVEPDIMVPREDALKTAHIHAREIQFLDVVFQNTLM